MVARDGRFAFVKAYGLDPALLTEMYVYTVAGTRRDLPPLVRDLLTTLHETGCAVGERIMSFLFHDRPLVDGEAIYVAITRATPRQNRLAIAFMDRDHLC